ncbi:MAG: sigma-70 family RNA polymerase sigma factor [Promicromonosporaceae bacterium]|nr:sigma-70 family RNA polymerase sigma factor [Promicromonosporaceae bacterium]
MTRWRAELDDLVARRGHALVGYAYVVCGNSYDAEDLVQEALFKVFSGLRRPSGPAATVHPLQSDAAPTNAEAYVRRAILSLYVDGYRRRVRWREREPLLVDDDDQRGPASGVSVRADVTAALAELSPQQRACVVLRFYEDLTVPQVAARLGLAEGTVKRHLSDATGRLRGLLTTDDLCAAPVRTPARALDGGTR